MKQIWVLGAGQLGLMLAHAAKPLAIDVIPIDIINNTKITSIPEDAIITAEIEQWPESELSLALSLHPNFINKNVFALTADRLTQKKLLDSLHIDTAPWCEVTTSTSIIKLHEKFGDKVLLKRRTGGYDGRGQLWLNEKIDIPNDWTNNSIAEQGIKFDQEISIIGGRSPKGKIVFYPLALNLHIDGILMASIAPLDKLNYFQTQAEDMLGKIMHKLDYVGVMAMETFCVNNKLLVNELAPRVHNSGHWTQTGTTVSQFQLHIRALANLALATKVKCQTVMINLIGMEFEPAWLELNSSEIFWYNKEVRPGRKLGHINIAVSTKEQLNTDLNYLLQYLPQNYIKVIEWIKQNV